VLEDLRKAKESAEAAENRLNAAIGAIDEGFAIYDPEDRLAMYNDKYREIYGLSFRRRGLETSAGSA
jgi:PAS domain-containing protein